MPRELDDDDDVPRDADTPRPPPLPPRPAVVLEMRRHTMTNVDNSFDVGIFIAKAENI